VETGGTDCNDTNATAYPGAEELCFDLVDNDCDGWKIDEGRVPLHRRGHDPIISEFHARTLTFRIPLGEWIEVMNVSEQSILFISTAWSGQRSTLTDFNSAEHFVKGPTQRCRSR
jgi:hypothetical protein